jgi:hypothetical protein
MKNERDFDLEDLTKLHELQMKSSETWVREQIRNVAEAVFYDLFGVVEKEDREEIRQDFGNKMKKKNEQFMDSLRQKHHTDMFSAILHAQKSMHDNSPMTHYFSVEELTTYYKPGPNYITGDVNKLELIREVKKRLGVGLIWAKQFVECHMDGKKHPDTTAFNNDGEMIGRAITKWKSVDGEMLAGYAHQSDEDFVLTPVETGDEKLRACVVRMK